MSFEFDGNGNRLWLWVVGLLLTALAFWLYRQELRRRKIDSWLGKAAAVLRALALLLIFLMLLEPTLRFRHIAGEPGRLVIAVDDSQSMERVDENGRSRWDAAAAALLDPNRFPLETLQERFDLTIVQSNGENEKVLWASTAKTIKEQSIPTEIIQPESYSSQTALGEFVKRHVNDSVLMFTDGNVTQGRSLVEAAEGCSVSSPPLFFVELGDSQSDGDSRIISLTAPSNADRKDLLTGEMTYEVETAEDVVLQVALGQEIVWRKEIDKEDLKGVSTGTANFAFLMEPIVGRLLEDQSRRNLQIEERSIALEFVASVQQSKPDVELRNNTFAFRVWVSLIRNRAIMLESRPRWETRYIRNALDRDPTWEIESIDLSSDERSEKLKLARVFQNVDTLSQYDLIIFGESPAATFPDAMQQVMEEYVAEAGGGVIFLDGSFGYFRDEKWGRLQDLLPVEFVRDDDASAADILVQRQVALTERAAAQNAFRIDSQATTSDEQANAWSELPPLYVQALVRPTATATTLAVARSKDDAQEPPVFVEQRVGAGMVFYSATDQTWKWRYKRADAVHRLFWTQICRQYSRKPFLVRTEAIDLDVAPRSFTPDEEVPIRVRLNQDKFPASSDRLVYAILNSHDTRGERRFLLQPEGSLQGYYRTSIAGLLPGHYRFSVETAGMSPLEQEIAADIYVEQSNRAEILSGTPDHAGMMKAAELTAGTCVRLNEIGKLVEQLDAIASGRVVRSNLALWQSYWMFIPLICLLAAEWLLRKRVGLI